MRGSPPVGPRFLILIATGLALSITPVDAVSAQGPVHRIQGRVTADSGKTPVAGADVIVTRGPDRKIFQATSDSAGLYRVEITEATGDYLVYVAAPAAASMVPYRRRITLTAPRDTVIALDVALVRRTVQALNAVKVVAAVPQPSRGGDDATIGTRVGGNDQQLFGVFASVPGTGRTDLTTMLGTLPGITSVNGGLSVGGVPSSGNSTVLNGMAMNGGSIPSGARRTIGAASGVYDPSAGNFSGLEQSVLISGGSLDIGRTIGLTADGSGFGGGDPLGIQRRGSRVTEQLAVGGEGPFAAYLARYNGGVDASFRADPLVTLSAVPASALSRLNLSADSVNKLRMTLTSLGIPELAHASSLDPATQQVTGVLRLNTSEWNYDNGRDAASSVGILAIGSSSSSMQQPGTMRFTTAGARSTSNNTGLQLFGTWYLKRNVLLETNAGYSAAEQRTTPLSTLPAANIRITSVDSTGARSVSTIGIGGSGDGASFARQSTWQSRTDIRFYLERAPTHRFKGTLDIRFDSREERNGSGSTGTFQYNSLAEFSANRPSGYALTLRSTERRSSAWTGALSFSDRWRPATRLTLQYGIRLDGGKFVDGPASNSAVASAFGVGTDALPSHVAISPRLAFTWQFKTKGGSAAQMWTEYAQVNVPATFVLRGGIGQFVSGLPYELASTAYANTGLTAASLRLSCLDAATPTPDWTRYVTGAASAPTSCAGGGGGVLSDAAPQVIALARGFRAPRSWRGNLNWAVGGIGWNVSLDGALSLNESQTGILDRNFANIVAFRTADEGRAVYVPATDIVAVSGSVPAGRARVNPAFGSVQTYQSDLRSRAVQFTASVQRFLRGSKAHPIFLELAYTYSDIRAQQRGFDGVVSNAPTDITWGRSDLEQKHALIARGNVRGNWINTELWMRWGSGLPFTPLVGGDVNGDGRVNDPAFLSDPATVTDASFARDLRTVLGRVSPEVRRCVERQFGSIAARNSCRGGWSGDLNVRLSMGPTISKRFPRIRDLSLTVTNVLGGLDHMLNGETLRGWGTSLGADPVLLVPTSFNSAAKTFTYAVNPAFGDARRGVATSVSPLRVVLAFQMNLAQGYDVQEMERALRPGRNGGSGIRVTEEKLFWRYRTNVTSPYQDVLDLSDSLFLTTTQSRGLLEAHESWTTRADSVWHVLAKRFAEMPADFDADLALKIQENTKADVLEMTRMDLKAKLGGILTPMQVQLIPWWVRNWFESTKPIKEWR